MTKPALAARMLMGWLKWETAVEMHDEMEASSEMSPWMWKISEPDFSFGTGLRSWAVTLQPFAESMC